MICWPTCLSWESGEIPRPLNTPAISHSLCPSVPPPSGPVETCRFEPSMCFWPPMPIATQAAGVRCICLIIIRLDRGVLKMKETNHRAPLSKVCLPGWGVLDLSPLSSLSFVASNARPTATSTPSHTHRVLLFLKSCLHRAYSPTVNARAQPPLLLATPLIHSQLQNCRNTPHPHILKDFRLSPLFFSSPPHKLHPPTIS